MAINNPFKITYGSRAVGGAADDYQLHGPYVFDKSFDTLRLVFDVVVVATSYATLQNLSDALESDFRKRDQTLIIDLDNIADAGGASTWTYTFGTHATNDGILNSTASLVKSGDAETDRGFSRSYTCTIEGELPADDSSTGLRELRWNVHFESGRQRFITMQGSYTALGGTAATAKYQDSAGADAEATTFLSALSGSGTYELVDEGFEPDRNDHVVQFTRQYVELLANQSQASLDDNAIRDHRVVFLDDSSHPGDSGPDLIRLRRVVASYDCAIDIDQTTNLQTTFDNTVRPHITALFQTNFNPSVFCVENKRIGYEETAKRMSVQMTFLYQPSGAGIVVEVTESVALREQQNIDYTPVHLANTFAANADPGWAIREVVFQRTIVLMGLKSPNSRIDTSAPAKAGWNIIQNTSQVAQRYIGDSTNEEQIIQTILTESIAMRFHVAPKGSGGGGGGIPKHPGEGWFGRYGT